jgi:hypothetical protein
LTNPDVPARMEPSTNQIKERTDKMAGYIDIPAAITQAEKLLAEKRRVLTQIDIVRTDLRHAVVMGGATAEQKQWVEKTFPLVERNRKKKE